jgi:hypothetical protein
MKVSFTLREDEIGQICSPSLEDKITFPKSEEVLILFSDNLDIDWEASICSVHVSR